MAPHFAAIKLLERDITVHKWLDPFLTTADGEAISALLEEFEASKEMQAEPVMSAVRHNMAFELFESVARVGMAPERDVRQLINDLLMHPIPGYLFLAGILTSTFALVCKVGNLVEPLFLDWFGKLDGWLSSWLPAKTLSYAVVHGIVTGLGGGIGIVVSYLLPFFVALALLEDTRYLPRIAFLMDSLMHHIGLHGMSVVPLIVGYGCSVLGVLATRILKSPRDRLMTATLTTPV